MINNSKKKQSTAMEDDVEELLKAAEDEMALKLSINSHMSRVSPSYLDSDLDLRFQSLKKPLSKPNKSIPTPKFAKSVKDDDGDDLLARFAALKGSMPSSSSSSAVTKKSDVIDYVNGGEDVSKDDEVERIMQWAIDAARLDPSPPTDDEAEIDGTDHDDSDQEDDDSDEDDDYRVKGNAKANRK